MRIDLDADGTRPEALPRFHSAQGQAQQLLRLGQVLVGLLAGALVLAFLIDLFAPLSIWPVVLVNCAATACVVLAGLQSARRIARWRAAAIGVEGEATVAAPDADDVLQGGWYERLLERVGAAGRRTFHQIGAPTLWLAGWAVLALLSLYTIWNLSLPAAASSAASNLGAGVLLLLAFGLLVFERQLTQHASEQWPEARALAQLLRALLAMLLVCALVVFLRSPTAVWPLRLAVLSGLLPMLMALELLMRAVASLFSPQQPRLEPRLQGESLVANLLRWPPQPLQALQDELRNRFGIDLRQVWAFSFMRRAFVPVLGVIAVIGWGLTGVREVPIDGRGIYERFGEPVEVFGPGLHLGLPWPFGQVISAENGQVHELATSVEAGAAPALSSAEGPPPDTANRLWDATHVNDKSQVIASSQGGQQGLQIVNLDVRFVYRIGLDDRQALAGAYHTADIQALIRSTASRVLVHEFASRTLDELLGEQRNDLSSEIGAAVQHDLQQLDSGVEILATVVEAIHPPAGAANAYHGVQAAQIAAQALIARERGAASQQRNDAQLQASTQQDNANAGAREVNAQAQAADRRFSAEQEAFASAGQAFLLEQYLSQLSLGLANAKLLVVDHRLGAAQAPTLDLRTFAVPVDPVSPAKTAP